MTLTSLYERLDELHNPAFAAGAARYFRSIPGGYGEGDRFAGIRVPALRQLQSRLSALTLTDLDALLCSPWHEYRLLALLTLAGRCKVIDAGEHQVIVDLYLNRTAYVNNWDLVDSSAPDILGRWLLTRDRDVLRALIGSSTLWERRIALLSTLTFIREGEFAPTLALVESVLGDSEDLIHKAAGWMLREVGLRSRGTLLAFLSKHYPRLPRTTLRYAIEKEAPESRKQMLRGVFA